MRSTELDEAMVCAPATIGARQYTACRSLWASVLHNAFIEAQSSGHVVGLHGDERRRAIKAAQRWFQSEEKHIGTFVWVCTMLDLNADSVRAIALQDAGQECAA